jgi:hypothetical protein
LIARRLPLWLIASLQSATWNRRMIHRRMLIRLNSRKPRRLCQRRRRRKQQARSRLTARTEIKFMISSAKRM